MYKIGTTHDELSRSGPTQDQWASIAALAEITMPSEETQRLTMWLIKDREVTKAYWEANTVVQMSGRAYRGNKRLKSVERPRKPVDKAKVRTL